MCVLAGNHLSRVKENRVIEKEFRNILKDSSSLLHKNICGIVVDESQTVETWTGKRFVPIVFILLVIKVM